MENKNLSQFIDHTQLKPTANFTDIDKLCDEARTFNFASVCVNPYHVERCAKSLKNTPVKVCTVIGFPLGANCTETKSYETNHAIKHGADEVDMVINIGALKSGDLEYVLNDIREVVNAAGGRTVKVIIETCYLTDEEKNIACELASKAGANFVKTSTGFGSGGAVASDVKLIKESIPSHMEVKASGGIRTKSDALVMITNGASRLGTSSGIKIVEANDESIS